MFFIVSWYSSIIPYSRDSEPLTCGSDPLAHISAPLVVWKTLPADVMTFFLLFTRFWAKNCTSADLMNLFLVFTRFWAENWTSADLMTFLLLYTRFLAENWSSADVMTFSWSFHPILGGKLDICGRDDLFLVFIRIRAENWSSAGAIIFFWSSPDFGWIIGHL